MTCTEAIGCNNGHCNRFLGHLWRFISKLQQISEQEMKAAAAAWPEANSMCAGPIEDDPGRSRTHEQKVSEKQTQTPKPQSSSRRRSTSTSKMKENLHFETSDWFNYYKLVNYGRTSLPGRDKFNIYFVDMRNAWYLKHNIYKQSGSRADLPFMDAGLKTLPASGASLCHARLQNMLVRRSAAGERARDSDRCSQRDDGRTDAQKLSGPDGKRHAPFTKINN